MQALSLQRPRRTISSASHKKGRVPQIHSMRIARHARVSARGPFTLRLHPAPRATCGPAGPPAFESLKQLGLPLNARDVNTLLHESLTNLMGQQTHIRPYIFSNLFQVGPPRRHTMSSVRTGLKQLWMARCQAPNHSPVSTVTGGNRSQQWEGGKPLTAESGL